MTHILLDPDSQHKPYLMYVAELQQTSVNCIRYEEEKASCGTYSVLFMYLPKGITLFFSFLPLPLPNSRNSEVT